MKVSITIMNLIIEINNFKKQYTNQLVVIKDIKITKRVTLIIGKNGSGKSTLLKAIAKLIEYEGEIRCDNKICFMSERVSYPIDLELDTFLLHLSKISIDPIEEDKREELMFNFSLENKKREKISSLSKGMAAKVNVIQCLTEKADIYLLDEPLSGLDKDGVKSLTNYIKSSDKVFIISTHLNNDFKDICDEVFYL